jgi:hypothetical protein
MQAIPKICLECFIAMGSIFAINSIQLIDEALVASLFGFRQKKTGFRRSELREETHEKA